MSVPHTGTNSLMKYLGQTEHMHIGIDDPRVLGLTEPVDVPIRDPYAVSISWESRYPGERIGRELDLWDSLIRYVSGKDDVTFHVMEGFPMHEGRGPEHPARNDPRAANELIRIRWLKDWILRPDRMAFFRQFYPEFSWL